MWPGQALDIPPDQISLHGSSGSTFPGLPRPSFPIFYGVNLQVETVHETKAWRSDSVLPQRPIPFVRLHEPRVCHQYFAFSFSFSFSRSRSLCPFWVEVHSEKVSYVAPICGKRFRYSQSDCCSLSSALFDRKKVEAESCDGFVIGVNLWSSFLIHVCSYDNGFIRRTPLQVAGGKRTSPPRMVCTCEHFNGKLVFYLKYLLFSFRLPPAWCDLRFVRAAF